MPRRDLEVLAHLEILRHTNGLRDNIMTPHRELQDYYQSEARHHESGINIHIG
jgi:hypothetical protein